MSAQILYLRDYKTREERGAALDKALLETVRKAIDLHPLVDTRKLDDGDCA